MNPIIKILATISFIASLPFIIIIGIYSIWVHKKPEAYNMHYQYDKTNNNGVSLQ